MSPRLYLPPLPDFPVLFVVLHAGRLYIGHPALVTTPVGGGLETTRNCMSPCWALRTDDECKIDDVIGIAQGTGGWWAGHGWENWSRCDGLEIVKDIVATMPITQDGLAEMCNVVGPGPFTDWILAEDTRLSTARAERAKEGAR